MKVEKIGVVKTTDNGSVIKIDEAYAHGLEGLKGFGHIQILWWFLSCDNPVSRSMLTIEQPYQGGLESIGVFATRSPERPNPIALTTSEVLNIDYERAEIHVAFMDAYDGTPVIDIKPYVPSFDRVERPMVPSWQAGWLISTEESGTFDWGKVFTF